jgi:hypothetical protein
MTSRLSERSTRAPRASREPTASSLAREQRSHQRQQGVQVSRQVDVHVGHHVGVADRPGGTQRASAALLVEMDHADSGELGRQSNRDAERGVRAGTVGDRDARGERKAIREMGV